MAANLKYKIIDCGVHGFGVAGPAVTPGADLELIHWGMTLVSATSMADALNGDQPVSTKTVSHDPPIRHLHD